MIEINPNWNLNFRSTLPALLYIVPAAALWDHRVRRPGRTFRSHLLQWFSSCEKHNSLLGYISSCNNYVNRGQKHQGQMLLDITTANTLRFFQFKSSMTQSLKITSLSLQPWFTPFSLFQGRLKHTYIISNRCLPSLLDNFQWVRLHSLLWQCISKLHQPYCSNLLPNI